MKVSNFPKLHFAPTLLEIVRKCCYYCGLVKRRGREKKGPVAERLQRVGLHGEERSRLGIDEQQLSDILFAPPPHAPTLHYNSFSARVKVRPDSSATVNGYVCFSVCVCVLTCMFCSAHTKQMGEMEMKRVRLRRRDETDLWEGNTVCTLLL